MTLEDQLKQSERVGFIKQIADKLFQGIRAVNDRGESRRWIWELVQNAKDAPNQNGFTNMRVTLDQERLDFEHNGDPFTISSLTGILQQVSDKSSTAADSATTGKFGTGFITTHILSTEIDLRGILSYEGGRKKFSIILDRAADRADQLIDKVNSLMRKKDELASDVLYPPLSVDYVPAEFETGFSYKLSPGTHKFAEQGVLDLERLAPYTFLHNEKINSITIVKKSLSEKILIQRKEAWTDQLGIGFLTVHGLDPSGRVVFEHTIAYKRAGAFTLSIPVIVHERQLTGINALPDFTPTLFKDFPLIGTEKWLFPFVCNCDNFEPTEPRDSLYLHQEGDDLSWQVKINREMIEAASGLAVDFIEQLAKISPMPEELFLLCRSGLPPKETHDDVKIFLKNVQAGFRDRLKEIPLVQTEDGYKRMNECRFPIISETVSESSINRKFYEIAVSRHSGIMPIAGHFDKWITIISEDIKAWGETISFQLTDLLDYVQHSGEIETLVLHNPEAGIQWLNELYAFLIDNGFGEYLRGYRLLINQDKSLISLNEAQVDAFENIPELLKDCGKSFDRNYRARLIYKGLRCSIFSNSLSIDMISDELNGEIGRLMVDPSSVSPIHLSAAARLCNVIVESSADDRRLNIVQHLGTIIPEWKDQPLSLEQLRSSFNFDSALKATVRFCLYKISRCGTIAKLQQEFGFKLQDKCIEWLDKLVVILSNSKTDIKALSTEYGIFPNQLGNLSNAKELLVDADSIADFIKDVHAELMPTANQRQKLLRNGFASHFVDGKYSFSEMANDIDLILSDNYYNKTGKNEAALKMIDWTSEKENQQFQSFFPRLSANKAFIVLYSLPDKKEPVFKLLRLKPDFEKLTAIAESEHFELLNQMAQSNIDIAQLNRLYLLAADLGGIDELETIAEIYIEEQSDLQFQKDLGSHVEELFRNAFSDYGDTFKVEREGFEHGQDFALIFPAGRIYRIEIKSFGAGKERVHMSIRQGETASHYPDSYALCVLERPTHISQATTEYFKLNSFFVPGIGLRLKSKVDAAVEIKDLIAKQQSDEESIAFDSTAYRFRIGKRVWTGPLGKSFDDFISELRELVSQFPDD